MEKAKIGFNAGKVWRILNKKGELSIHELCREVSMTFEDVAMAIGWLSREGKVNLIRKGDMLFLKIEDVQFSFG